MIENRKYEEWLFMTGADLECEKKPTSRGILENFQLKGRAHVRELKKFMEKMYF